MVFGVNTANGLSNATKGELDVWVRADALAEVTGIPEDDIRKLLTDGFQPFDTSHMDFVVRLRSNDEAKRLVSVLLNIANTAQESQ